MSEVNESTMPSTDNLGLNLPQYTDAADIADLNENFETIDEQLGGTIAIAKGGTGATTAAGARTNLGLGAAAEKGVDTSIEAASESAKLPTSAAVAAFVEGKGYLTSHQSLSGCVQTTGDQSMSGVLNITNTTDATSNGSAGALKVSGGIYAAKKIYGQKVYNAVWNDYAECRKADINEPGRCITETPKGIMEISTERLMPACKIISDTFGSCMGETDEARTPIAVAGRVLAIPYRDREKYKIGDAVCSAPNGTVDIMSRREIRKYSDRIVGIVSEIPGYKVWIGGSKEDPQPIEVNGRIWIYVR